MTTRTLIRTAIVGPLVAAGLVAFAPANASADEITVTIDRVSALDKGDALSRPDFLARVTIAGELFVTKPILNQTDIQPTDWVFRKSVSPGQHEVKVEILDKDITKNDFVDINRIDGKRDLDFTVNTRRCTITGFSPSYRCGDRIIRAGAERRKAEITFRVDARR